MFLPNLITWQESETIAIVSTSYVTPAILSADLVLCRVPSYIQSFINCWVLSVEWAFSKKIRALEAVPSFHTLKGLRPAWRNMLRNLWLKVERVVNAAATASVSFCCPPLFFVTFVDFMSGEAAWAATLTRSLWKKRKSCISVILAKQKMNERI